jgi:hypothetical protein
LSCHVSHGLGAPLRLLGKAGDEKAMGLIKEGVHSQTAAGEMPGQPLAGNPSSVPAGDCLLQGPFWKRLEHGSHDSLVFLGVHGAGAATHSRKSAS